GADYARAMSVPESKPSHCFSHSTDQSSGRCHGRAAVPEKHGSFHRPIASVLRVYDPTGTRSRRCHARFLRDTCRLTRPNRRSGFESLPRTRIGRFISASDNLLLNAWRPFFSFTRILFGELFIVLRKLRNIAGRAGFHLTLATPCTE